MAAIQVLRVAYELYLADFPAGEYDSEVRYAYAEMLYKRERFDEAFEQYHHVISRDPSGKNARFCASSAIFAADQMLQLMEGDPIWTDHLKDAADLYAANWPHDEKSASMLYKAAYAAYQVDDFDDARSRFDTVITSDPGSSSAGNALALVLHSYAIEQDWNMMADTWLDYSDGFPELRVDVEQIDRLIVRLEDAGDMERSEAPRASME